MLPVNVAGPLQVLLNQHGVDAKDRCKYTPNSCPSIAPEGGYLEDKCPFQAGERQCYPPVNVEIPNSQHEIPVGNLVNPYLNYILNTTSQQNKPELAS